jgi:ATP-dependent exoDNAse (exonuclease V) alpha subunit
MVADVMKARSANPDKSNLVLAYTRDDVADLNAMIKAEMVKSGKVSDKNMEVAVTVKDGDQDYQETQDFALGDRILFRENNRDMGVMNGSFGTLKAVEDGQFSVKLDNGNTVNFSPQEYTRFQLGYASTVHQSQGMTVDQSFVLATPHFDRHTTYVAMSRHKDKANLYASTGDFRDNASLNRSLGREGEKLSTLDFTDTRSREIMAPERSQEHRHQNHDDQNLLRQQDIKTLREQFMKRAQLKSQEPGRNSATEHRPDRGNNLER